MIGDIVTMAFTVILRIVFTMINALMIPIDTAIATLLPNLSQAFGAIADFITIITSYLGFAISLTGIPPWVIVFMASYFIFILTVPIGIYGLKLAVRWYFTVKR